jgi:acyl-CoA thioesterase-1
MMRSIGKGFSLFSLWVLAASLLSAPPLYAGAPVILILGDSLSAGYGMALADSWPRLMQERLDREGHSYRVVNASITGDTTQGGLARLPRLLERHQPEVVIIELGGNDGLRGLGIETTRENLAAMIQQSQDCGARVLLTGIQLPPNYGIAYTDRFRDMYTELASVHGTLLVPFLMDGVALNAELMQSDGVHPNASAQPVMLDNVWSALKAILR